MINKFHKRLTLDTYQSQTKAFDVEVAQCIYYQANCTCTW